MEDNRPSYWAVLPASVRYDQTLRPNGKLLYAEISSLCAREGFCWADNEYFAQLYSVTERSIRQLIKQLEELGYIRIELIQRGNQNQKEVRHIFTAESYPLRNKNSTAEDFGHKNASAPEQKFRAPEQTFRSSLNNNKNNNIPPISPTDATDALGNPSVSADGADSSLCTREPVKRKRGSRPDYKAQADHLPDRFEKFWAYYCDSIPDDRRKAGNRQKAINAWDKLSPSPGLIAAMGAALAEQVKGQSWQDGIGIPHASTWLNGHSWEDPTGAGHHDSFAARRDGWD